MLLSWKKDFYALTERERVCVCVCCKDIYKERDRECVYMCVRERERECGHKLKDR